MLAQSSFEQAMAKVRGQEEDFQVVHSMIVRFGEKHRVYVDYKGGNIGNGLTA